MCATLSTEVFEGSLLDSTEDGNSAQRISAGGRIRSSKTIFQPGIGLQVPPGMLREVPETSRFDTAYSLPPASPEQVLNISKAPRLR
jgi:hypothetical protein